MDSPMGMIHVFDAFRDGRGLVGGRRVLNSHSSERRHSAVVGQSLLANNPGIRAEGISDIIRRVVETGEPDPSARNHVRERFDGCFFQSVVKLGDGVATSNSTERKRAEQQVLRLQGEVAQAWLA